MATAAIYNGFGKYEKNGRGETGITLTYGGVPFWLPYKKLTYIPDFTFREVDHDKTTAEEGEEGVLTYKSFRVSGERIVEELLETQVPTPNKDKGIIRITSAKRTGKFLDVYAGITEEGQAVTVEVPEVEMGEGDAAQAERLARLFKEQTVQEYFQSKRERMAGGQGRLTPLGLTKVFMEELGIKDIDALPAQGGGNTQLEEMLTRILANAATPGTSAKTAAKAKASESVADLV